MKRDQTSRREYFRAWARNNYIKKIALLKEIKLKSGCVDCGYNSNSDALEFDHLPQYKRIACVSALLSSGEKAWKDEIKKCEVVCANCHAIRTASRRRLKENITLL